MTRRAELNGPRQYAALAGGNGSRNALAAFDVSNNVGLGGLKHRLDVTPQRADAVPRLGRGMLQNRPSRARGHLAIPTSLCTEMWRLTRVNHEAGEVRRLHLQAQPLARQGRQLRVGLPVVQGHRRVVVEPAAQLRFHKRPALRPVCVSRQEAALHVSGWWQQGCHRRYRSSEGCLMLYAASRLRRGR